MNSKGEEKIKSLGMLAKENNLSLAFLKKQINLNKLRFEKKSGNFYSSQKWINDYKKNFTFSGFMMDRVYGQDNVHVVKEKKSSLKKENKKQLGKIIKEKKTNLNIDIEKVFVKKWNKEFKEINNQFDDFIKNSNKIKTKKNVNDFVKNPHNIHSAVIAMAIMFLLSFYSVTMMPGTANSFTKRIDSIIKTPYEYLNNLAIKNINAEDNLQQTRPSSEQLANYIKNKTNNISYVPGSSIKVEKQDILGRVAGVSEEYDGETFLEKVRKTSLDIFVKISDKQKRASLKLNDKLNGFISSIKK